MKSTKLQDVLASATAGYWGKEKGTLGEDVLVIRNGDLQATGVRWDHLPRRALTTSEIRKSLVRKGDVLLTTSGECGRVAMVAMEPTQVTCVSNFVRRLRFRESVSPRYAYHFMRTSTFQTSLAPYIRGVTIKNLSTREAFAGSIFPVPPMHEQQRITAILDAADAIRTKRRHILAHMDALTTALFDVMFGGSAFPTEPLSNLASITSGLTKGRRTSAPTTAIPYLAVANVQSGHFRLGQVKTIEATDGEIARFALRDGDLVLTEGGDPDKLGRGAIWRSQIPLCLHQNHIFRVRISRASLQPEYLAAYIASPEARSYFLRAAKQTTGIASINMKQLRGLSVPVPPVDRQAEYVAALDAINTQRARVDRALTLDDELFASLQYRAFRGEL
jgi:type I restriction enzyme S subunit